MLKLKNIVPVFVALLFLGVSSTAFAQLSCSVASTPVSRATATGLTEPAGDLIFNCTAGGTGTTTATMTISYQGLMITDSTTWPSATGGVRIANATGSFAAAGATPTISAVNNASGSVVISIPFQAVPANGSFTLSGVTLALAGTGVTSVQATVSVSPGNNVLITAGQNVATVITSVLDGLKAASLTAGTTGFLLTSGTETTAGSSLFKVSVTENYIDMLRSLAQFNGGNATNSVQLLYTFSGIPTGLTLSNCAASASTPAGAEPGGSVTLSATSVSAAANTLTATIAGNLDLTNIDTVTVSCGGAGNFTATAANVPFSPGSITATVTLAPNGTALCTTQTNSVCATGTTGQIPRYTVANLGPVTVFTLISPTTHMLFPYAAIGNGFDTGFVVTNTTADPYGTKGGGASAIAGPVTLAFYNAASGSTPFCVSTGAGAATVSGIATCTTLSATGTGSGTGLSSGGVVASGNSWVVLGSQLFAQVTGAPTVFQGYVFGIANFPYAHPLDFVADATFSGKFASGGPALVLANPAVIARAGANFTNAGLVESLGH